MRINKKIKMPSPLGGHVFQRTGTIFELNQHIIKKNFFDKVTRRLGIICDFYSVHKVFLFLTCFELGRCIIRTNVLTKFHEDRTRNVTSRLKCPAPLQSCFSSKHIIETNLLTKFHEDWTINVASRELTRQMLTPHNAQRTTVNVLRTTDKRRSQKLTKIRSILPATLRLTTYTLQRDFVRIKQEDQTR
ncbi:hypothetical protein DPMN_095480 [Dreissena polymorpha]|uniref:Uncharacterized protein n=1 Tax=Dreissena polymorpha TaxID=45954 RepID=A0A9D4R2X0_DREPO|nr:hypothetical protein DPMN_095480 [Dreissena polymorpha]